LQDLQVEGKSEEYCTTEQTNKEQDGPASACRATRQRIQGLARTTGPAKFLDGHARVSLFEEPDNLLIGKSGLFHSRYSPK